MRSTSEAVTVPFHIDVTSRRSSSHWLSVPSVDLCTVTGRARLSYRRPAELFSETTGGWMLHQVRHSALTHAAEHGSHTPILLARSRHASVRSLERYARPGPEVVARHVAEHAPARRRRP